MTAIPGPTAGDGTQLQWRAYPPGFHTLPVSLMTPSPTPTPTPGPCVLLVHGGSFDAGNPFQPDVERVAEVIADDGYWVFVGDYRLAPCGGIPAQAAHPHPVTTPTPSAGPTATPDPSGRPPEQTDDVMSLILAVRSSGKLNGKVGIMGVSTGGCVVAYPARYRGTISGTGRPAWDGGAGGVRDDRPDCVVTFSSPL
jgi:pimeloyl-ACP methyl ester carboxylesterase